MTAAAAAVVHASDRTRVTRLTLDERTVIRKEPLGTDAQRRLRHEVGMLERLRGAEGVAQLVDAPQYPDSIVMEDAGRTTLAELAKPLDTDDLIALAVQLARALAAMHGRGVMHRDIAPANIVVSPSGAPCLVDFALATAFAEIRPEFTHHSEIVGALPYLAPEQTGRTGRPVDQRADLYALGATLYELATGEPAVRLRRSSATDPRSPGARAGGAGGGEPGPPGSAVGDRHASAREGAGQPVPVGGGRASTTWSGCGTDSQGRSARMTFRRGCWRRPGWWGAMTRWRRWRRPSRRRGRASAGWCWSPARPGVGKTALVNELRPAVTGRDGWFVAGKFDQYRRDLEFDGVYQVFRALGRLLLAEPEDELAELRGRILEALGPNAGLDDRGRARVRRAARCAAGSRGSADRTGTGAAERRGAAAGDRHPRTPARRVRRRSAMGGPHASRSVRPRTERGADRRPAARRRVPRG